MLNKILAVTMAVTGFIALTGVIILILLIKASYEGIIMITEMEAFMSTISIGMTLFFPLMLRWYDTVVAVWGAPEPD